MAPAWMDGAGKKIAIILGGGVVATGAGYIIYRYLRRKSIADKDEGFEDVPKLDEPVEKKVLVLGLTGAGKTSLLACLGKQDTSINTKPTEGFNVMCVQTERVSLNVWEIGGGENMRKYWSNFIQDTSVLVFVVDSSEERLFPEAFSELHKVLGDDRLRGIPVIVVANKQDLPQAQSPQQVLHALALDTASPREHKVHVLKTQVPTQGERKGVSMLKGLLISLGS